MAGNILDNYERQAKGYYKSCLCYSLNIVTEKTRNNYSQATHSLLLPSTYLKRYSSKEFFNEETSKLNSKHEIEHGENRHTVG